MSAAREVILQRIRTALGDVPSEDAEPPRDYRMSDPGATAARVADLTDRLLEYKAAVRQVPAAQLPAAIAAACAARQVRKLVVPADIPADWMPAGGRAFARSRPDECGAGGERRRSHRLCPGDRADGHDHPRCRRGSRTPRLDARSRLSSVRGAGRPDRRPRARSRRLPAHDGDAALDLDLGPVRHVRHRADPRRGRARAESAGSPHRDAVSN